MVTLAEVVDDVSQPFATITLDGGGEYARAHGLAWRCERRQRTLVADAVAPDGSRTRATMIVRTPSCAHRFAVSLLPRTAVRVGSRLMVRIRDGWATGGAPVRVCLRGACQSVEVGRRQTIVRLRPTHAGHTGVRVRGTGFRVAKRLEIRARHAPLRVLATGDSMIQIIDTELKARLKRGAQVTSDARISTGISKTLMLDWVAQARRQARAKHPQVTVMFIGANDGFAISGVACCDERWIRRYTARVRTMMASYRRGGLGRVYWLTLPAPRDEARKRIYHAVNLAIRAAASAYARDEVAVIDLVPIFTPGERFRPSIRGRVVRQGDGVHLNVAGAAIAAREIVRRMRADGLT
jgi:lysophospholipase L1-like esterase